MYVKRLLRLTELHLSLEHEEPFAIQLGDRKKTTIEFVAYHRWDDEIDDFADTIVACTIHREIEPKLEVLEMFEGLAAGRLPRGTEITDRMSRHLNADGEIKDDWLPRLVELPSAFQDFVRSVDVLTRSLALDMIRALRWRMGIEGQHNPIEVDTGLQWSLDGATWRRMPSSFNWLFRVGRYPKREEVPVPEIVNFVRSHETEPLGHELWREAWHARVLNPRSASITGLSALEVGFKHYVAAVVPHAEWLISNVPSPPIERLLRDYFPTLPTRAPTAPQIVPLPDSMMSWIGKWAQIRNKVTHQGVAILDPDDLEETLLTIRDILWMFDFYLGHEWAWEYVRNETKAAMNGPSP